jgi:hypothetical protein
MRHRHSRIEHQKRNRDIQGEPRLEYALREDREGCDDGELLPEELGSGRNHTPCAFRVFFVCYR